MRIGSSSRTISKFSRPLFVLVLLAIGLATPAVARSGEPALNGIRIRLGDFSPRGDSEYWRDREVDFFGDAKDLADGSFGFDYVRRLGPRWGAQISIGSWEGDHTTAYRDFVDIFGDEIEHTVTLETQALTAGLVFNLLPTSAPVVPYVGAGAGFFSYDLTESGDFIDFVPAAPVIFSATSRGDGVAVGVYGLVGLEVPLGDTLSLFGEARWTGVDDNLAGDFEDFGEISLGGRELSLGVAFNF